MFIKPVLKLFCWEWGRKLGPLVFGRGWNYNTGKSCYSMCSLLTHWNMSMHVKRTGSRWLILLKLCIFRWCTYGPCSKVVHWSRSSFGYAESLWGYVSGLCVPTWPRPPGRGTPSEQAGCDTGSRCYKASPSSLCTISLDGCAAMQSTQHISPHPVLAGWDSSPAP